MPVALQQEGGQPASELYRTIHRVAERMEPRYRQAFLEAVQQTTIDDSLLLASLRRKDAAGVINALGLTSVSRRMQMNIQGAVQSTILGAGEAVSTELSSSLGVSFSFDTTNPNAVIAARRNAATMVRRVTDETRQSIRNVVGNMFTEGVPPEKAAREIRTMVGLREQHMKAVRNFRAQVEAGEVAAVDRRLDAATKQRIRSAIRRDVVDPDFVDDVAETYRKSLLNRRANDIARTETIRASSAGTQQTWRQAADKGLIDREQARRVWIVTPDDRLRPSHAAIPGMNPGGVRLNEPFDTPFGPMMHPPAGVNCRCATSLAPNGLGGGII